MLLVKLKYIFITITLLFWPLSLFFSNTWENFLIYTIPAVLISIYFLFSKKNKSYYLYPILPLPLIEPKLALVPILLVLGEIIFSKSIKKNLLPLIISLLILSASFSNFFGQTIFTFDYEARQKVIRDTHLYPNVFLARLFHNKLRIIFNKFNNNVFALIDPNNYFFGFHPRQFFGNQHLKKFPTISIIFTLYGLFKINQFRYKKFFLIVFFSSILGLSTLKIFDRHDVILWIPVSMIFIHGFDTFTTDLNRNRSTLAKILTRHKNFFVILIVVFSFIELLQLVIHQTV